MNRRDFIRSSAVLLAGCSTVSDVGVSPTLGGVRKPNIVLIVADDLGYGELGAYGGTEIPTPNIDSLADNGVRFTQGYVSCPVCSPTRAGLMTGRYQQRFGHEFNPGPPEEAEPDFGLPRSETILPERLKALGYATGMVGKWHLGFQPELTPPQRGFDEFFGFLAGSHTYFGNAKGARLLRSATPVRESEYLTDAFAREAVDFMERHKDEPFFLYLPFNAVHGPLEAEETYLARFPNIEDEKRRTFCAMLSALDDAVGQVLSKAGELGLEENTLIVFISDNGGPTLRTSSGNGPLRGQKSQMFEGGIRVPFMMQWKGQMPAGQVYEQPTISLDIHPTVMAAAGATVEPQWKLDGVDLFPYLAGSDSGRPHETLCWRMGERHAIRHGDWKLAVEPAGVAPMLFDLARDREEQHDLAAEMPTKAEELADLYAAWDSQMEAPRWRGRTPATAVPRRRQR